MKERKYTSIYDYQAWQGEGGFSVGLTLTAQEWKEKAMFWSDSDGVEERYNYFKNYDISNWYKEMKLIKEINEIWGIQIVPSDYYRKQEV